ncbi:hypothetical protein U9M48_030881 [Paspalum notatum var. saurae]|uniref:DUF4220 domain-containing protein n=1 Tax=Paspalum notatum var. saurae TaxID=547442 RepID=A0AAQ3U1N3_PASNO
MDVRPQDLWIRWGIQFLLLLSLTLQAVLLPLAGVRCRRASMLQRAFLWLLYQLADSTASYALASISLGNTNTEREHQLVPFWVPFLLLHLGSPDSIGAYAFEDNQLWLRHLQILLVQLLEAMYILYKYFSRTRFDSIALATTLMCAVGVTKYVESVEALRRGNLDSIRSSPRKKQSSSTSRHYHFHALDQDSSKKLDRPAKEGGGGGDDDEAYLRRSHYLFNICKCATVDSWLDLQNDLESETVMMFKELRKGDFKSMWGVMEMELSLMYDVIYTKASVIHTWPGYSIHLTSSVAVVASLLLFHFRGNKEVNSSADVGVTCTLLAGAVILESASLLGALGSTWAYAFLCTTRWSWLQYNALCIGRWDQLRRLVKKIKGTDSSNTSRRRWSGKMGQYNMLHFCSRRGMARRPLLGRLVMTLGRIELEELWDRWHYAGTIDISDRLRSKMFDFVKGYKTEINTQGVIRKRWGEHAFLKNEEQVLYEIMNISVNTGLVQSMIYRKTCENMTDMWKEMDKENCPKDELAKFIYKDNPDYCTDKPRLSYANRVAKKLLEKDSLAVLQLLLDVWMDFLVYAANRCSRESHVKKLSTGSELTTVLWIMTDHLYQEYNALEDA